MLPYHFQPQGEDLIAKIQYIINYYLSCTNTVESEILNKLKLNILIACHTNPNMTPADIIILVDQSIKNAKISNSLYRGALQKLVFTVVGEMTTEAYKKLLCDMRLESIGELVQYATPQCLQKGDYLHLATQGLEILRSKIIKIKDPKNETYQYTLILRSDKKKECCWVLRNTAQNLPYELYYHTAEPEYKIMEPALKDKLERKEPRLIPFVRGIYDCVDAQGCKYYKPSWDFKVVVPSAQVMSQNDMTLMDIQVNQEVQVSPDRAALKILDCAVRSENTKILDDIMSVYPLALKFQDIEGRAHWSYLEQALLIDNAPLANKIVAHYIDTPPNYHGDGVQMELGPFRLQHGVFSVERIEIQKLLLTKNNKGKLIHRKLIESTLEPGSPLNLIFTRVPDQLSKTILNELSSALTNEDKFLRLDEFWKAFDVNDLNKINAIIAFSTPQFFVTYKKEIKDFLLKTDDQGQLKHRSLIESALVSGNPLNNVFKTKTGSLSESLSVWSENYLKTLQISLETHNRFNSSRNQIKLVNKLPLEYDGFKL